MSEAVHRLDEAARRDGPDRQDRLDRRDSRDRLVRRSLPDAVFDRLAGRIVRGELAAGDALPSERELVEQFGVNRGAVREALHRLAQAGLVAVRHGGATRVLDYRRTAGLELLGRLVADPAGRIDVDVARSIVEMRAALGPDVARLAARRGGPECAARLAAVVTAMAEAGGDLRVLQRLALDFWELLVEASGNIAYRLAWNGLRRTYEPLRDLLVFALRAELADEANYADLAGAVARGDEAAAAGAARELLDAGTTALLAVLDGLPGALPEEGR